MILKDVNNNNNSFSFEIKNKGLSGTVLGAIHHSGCGSYALLTFSLQLKNMEDQA